VTTSLVAAERQPAASRGVAPWLSGSSLTAAGIATTAVALVAAIHIDDRYAVDHASGARIALARYAAQGVLYPPLVGDDSFGGTRFMPLPVILHAAVSRLTGEYLLSGKLLSLATMLAVGLVMFWVLRGKGCPVPLSAGLVGVVLTTQTGLLAATGLRADSLPLVLQLLAVATAFSSSSRRSTWIAAALAALAVTAKLHAVWAPVAIAIWLWSADRRRLRHFVLAYVGLTAALLGLLTAVTRGRLVENVFGLSTAGITGPAALLTSPYRLLHLMVAEAPGMWFLLPFALAVGWLAVARKSVDPWHLSLLVALLVLLVVLSDEGTGGNQLLDTAVLTAIVVGHAAGSGQISAVGLSPTALTGVVVWILVTGIAVTVGPAAREALSTLGDSSRYRPDPLASIADGTTKILSEDPYVPVSLGQDPVVLDPFMLLRIGRDDPAAVQALVNRIDAQDFDLVVLVEPLGRADWWADYHFGTDVIAALQRSYALTERVQGYDVYRPRPEE
jgi:hypothetical protein